MKFDMNYDGFKSLHDYILRHLERKHDFLFWDWRRINHKTCLITLNLENLIYTPNIPSSPSLFPSPQTPPPSYFNPTLLALKQRRENSFNIQKKMIIFILLMFNILISPQPNSSNDQHQHHHPYHGLRWYSKRQLALHISPLPRPSLQPLRP